jgi:hypothetical protein
MKTNGFWIALLVMHCVIMSVSVWFCWPMISGRLEIHQGTQAIKQFNVTTAISVETDFHANTYTNQLSSQTIKELYNRAAKVLSDKSTKTESFSWEDIQGWPRVSTVLQTVSGYVEVCGSCNNDNDSITILFRPGTFARKGAKKLSTYEMPKGTLRCDWE